jgi:hypothetical protein
LSTKSKREPWHPAGWDIADAAALQALSRGEATPDQQRRALTWIITSAAMTYDETFVAGQADVSDYLAGRRSVGNQVVKLLHINTAVLRRTIEGNPA